MANIVKEKESDLPVPAGEKMGGLSVADYCQIIAGAKELPDTEVDALEIVMQILGANSLEEGLADSKAQSLNDLVNEIILIHDAKLQKGDDKYKDAGSKVFLVIDATHAKSGERMVLTSGALPVLGAVGLIHKLNNWDAQVLVKQVDTKDGFKTTKLVHVAGALPPKRDTEQGF